MQSPPCSLENFTHFFNARAYDIIGEGTFRKHLTTCKDSADPWALEMVCGIQSVLGNIKSVNVHVAKLQQSYPKVGNICKNVTLAAQPPIRLHAGQTYCEITQQPCSHSLCLPSGTRGVSTYVHVRFCRFFMFLWFVSKIEYVVRCYVRSWLQTQDKSNSSYVEIAEQVLSMQPLLLQLHSVFVSALQHINTSVEEIHRGHSTAIIVLEKK